MKLEYNQEDNTLPFPIHRTVGHWMEEVVWPGNYLNGVRMKRGREWEAR
jgi:hypothetical protein